MTYRITETRDLELISTQYQIFFPAPPCDRLKKDDLQNTSWYVVTTKGMVVGFAGIIPTSSRTADLNACAVNEQHRGHGLQRRLIARRLKLARAAGVTSVTTHVQASNIRSLNNLVDFGFRAVGARYLRDAGDGKPAEYLDLEVILGGKK